MTIKASASALWLSIWTLDIVVLQSLWTWNVITDKTKISRNPNQNVYTVNHLLNLSNSKCLGKSMWPVRLNWNYSSCWSISESVKSSCEDQVYLCGEGGGKRLQRASCRIAVKKICRSLRWKNEWNNGPVSICVQEDQSTDH